MMDLALQLLEVLGKGGIVLLLAAGATLVVGRRGSAARRHFIWVLGLGGVALVTAAALLLPSWAAVPTAAAWWPAPAVPAAVASEAFIAGDPVPPGWAPISGSVPPAEAAALPSRLVFLASLWGLGAAVLLVRIAADVLAAARLVRAARPLVAGTLPTLLVELGRHMGLPRVPALRIAAGGTGPITAGLFRSVIVLPQAALAWPPAQQRAVLAHELAHVRRRDCVTQTMARIVTALHWPNPLAWLAVHRLRVEREMAADDVALGQGERASDYAGVLLALAGLVPAAPCREGAVLAMAASPLAARVERVLDGRRSRRGISRALAGLGALAVLGLAVPIGCLSGAVDVEPRGDRLVYDLEGAPDEALTRIVRERIDAANLREVQVEARRTGTGTRMVVTVSGATPAELARLTTALEQRRPLVLAVERLDGALATRLFTALHHDPDPRGLEGVHELRRLRGQEEQMVDRHVVAPLPALRAYVERTLAKDHPELRQQVMFHTRSDGKARTVIADATQRVTLAHTRAAVERDERGRPQLALTFGGDAPAVRALTANPAHLGRRLVIAFGDEVLSAPTLQSPMGDRARITFGSDDTDADAEALARAINDGDRLPLRRLAGPLGE